MEENQNQGGAFGSFPQEGKSAFGPKKESDDIANSLAEIVSSVRILEDRYLNLRKKSQLSDQNLIELQKEFFKEKKHLNQELMDAKLKIQELLNEFKIIKGELQDVVKQRDIKSMNTYLDLWEPMQFVTRKEAQRILEELKEQRK